MKLNDESLVIDIAEDKFGLDIRPQLVESDDLTWYSTNYEAEIRFIAWPAPVANAGGPYAGYEGQIIELDASKSTASTSDLSYRWDYGNDGTWDYSSTDPRAVYTLPDAGEVTVLLEVSDGKKNGTTTTKVTVNNMSPSALIASVTGAISTASKPGKILILGDGYSEGDMDGGPIIGTADVLREAGFTVDIAPVKSDSWTGDNPSLDDYALVILLVGADTKSSSSGDVTLSDMPQSGQTALMRFVMNGGGLVFAEWISLQIRDYGYYTGFQDLVMLDWNKWDEQKSADTYKVKANHPITKGLSSSFLAPYHWYSSGIAKPGATVLIQGTNPHKYDAVMVKQFNAGKVVEFSWANNWAEYMEHLSPWSDNMKTLYTNAASWASGRMGVSSLTAIQGDELTFNVESSDTGLNQDLAYTFTWGDGSTSIVTIPATDSLVRTAAISHTYPHSGPYAVTLSVSDSLGGTSLLQTVEVTIQREPVIADAGLNQTVTEGTTVTFNASRTTSGDESILTYVWNFGDGSATEGAVDLVAPTHLYPDNGVYTVTVTVTDDIGLTSADTMTVTVTNVAPTVEAGANLASDEGSPVVFAGGFTDPGADTHTYLWVFGDGATATATLTPTHTYVDNGVYTVTLTVTDDDGGVGVDTLSVTVTNVPPTAEAGADQTADEGTAIAFSGSFTDPGALDTHTYLWAFGDGGTATGTLSPSHVYSDNGVYMVTLTVPDKDGGVGQDTLVVTVLDLAPRAGFTWAPEPQSEGSPVTFTDCSTSSPDSIAVWAWTIDGQIFAQRSPTYAFADNGEYIVSLKVTDDDGSTSTITHTVNVINVAPTSEAGLDQTVDEGSPVVFAGNFTDPGADAHTIAWVFGDGATETGSLTPTHTYTDDGVYTVTLTVTDKDGGVGADTLTVTVGDLAPSAAFTWAPEPQGEGSPTQFTDASTSSPDAIVFWVWTIDGQTFIEQSPAYAFMENGAYTVTLTVTDNDGSTSTVSHLVNVVNVAPNIEAGAGQTSDEGSPITFAGGFTDPGAIDTHTIVWVFGDGATATGTLTPTHTYVDNGVYTVKLTVTDDDGGVGSDSLTVTVNNVVPTVEAGANLASDEGSPVTFSGSFTDPGADAHTIAWVFGDGATTTGSLTPTHTYTDDGVYTVKLTVTDDDSGVGADTLTVTVGDLAPKAEFTWTPEPQNEGSSVTFTDCSTSSPDSIAVWAWTIDGQIFAQRSPTYAFAENGAYTVTLKVTDDDGSTSTVSHIVNVVNVVPVVDAGVDQTTSKDTLVAFTGVFTDPGADTHTVTWSFGDGASTAGTLFPTHNYADNGVYVVTLTVTDDDGGVGIDTLIVTVNNVPPTTEAGPDVSGNINGTLTFTGDATDPGVNDILTYVWDFGDGTLTVSGVNMKIATHSYAEAGTYTVTLTVTDKDGDSGSDTARAVINYAPVADAGPDQTVDEGATVTFDSSATSDPDAGDVLAYVWDFGDGSATAGGVGLIHPTHLYADNGVYTVTLTVTDNHGSTNIDSMTVAVINVAPTVEAGPGVSAFAGVEVTFTGDAIDPGATDVLTYVWDFGDGFAIVSGVDLTTPTHTYADAGVYTVTLTVTDKDGGYATDSITVTILSLEVPTTSISLSGTQGENGWYTSNVAVTLNAEGDTFKAIHYSVDGGTENVLTSTDASFTLTTEEVHTITYYSVSVAGLAEDEQTAEVKMDWTAPTVQITSPTQGQVFTPTSTINRQYTVTDNVDANPTITVDPSSFPSPLPLGDLTITITATDAAGNTATKSITVKVQETTVKTPRQLKNDAKSLLLGSKTGIRDIDYAIDAAVALIDKSLNPQYWIDDSHLKDDHGIKVFIYEGKAAGGLQTNAILYEKSIPTLQKLIDQMTRQHKDTTQQSARLAAMQKLIPIFKEAAAMLAEADEGLAKTALDEANALTPPKNGSSFATALKNAEKEYNDGLSDEAAGNPTKAIEDFKQSWIHSRQAAHIQ